MSDKALAEGYILYIKTLLPYRQKAFLAELEKSQPKIYRLVMKGLK